jgi:hypothetical protein
MAEFPTYFINNFYLYFDNDMPKYLLDTNKQLLLGQLFDFQIHHICEHLKIPFMNEFGIHCPNKLLLDQIKEYNLKTFPKDCDTCKQIGLGQYKKQPNKFSLQNIGGKLVQPIELTVSQNFLTIHTMPVFEQSDEILAINLPVDNRFLIDVPLKKAKEKAPLLKDFVDSIEKRITIGLENIKKTKNKIEKLGKINYSENSSYIDVILMLFIVPIENSAFSDIFDIGSRITKIKKDFISTHFKNKLNKKELISKIMELNRILNSYKEKIFGGEIINSQLFRITLQTNFNQPGLLTHPYYFSKNSFPIFDFFKDILKLSIINTHSFTSLNKFFIHPDNPTIFSGNTDIPQEDILHTVQEQHDEPAEHICLEIKGDILKYLVTRDTYKMPTDNREFLCPICNEFISKFDKTHMKFHRSNKIVFNQILELQLDLHKTETVIANQQEYQRVIYQYSIYNAKSISFHMNRFEKRINKQSHMEEPHFVYEIPVYLEEVITDKNDNNYRLKAIITQTTYTTHLLFFCVSDIWYVFNSQFDPELQSDYIIQIGNFTALSKYQDELVKRLGVIYIYHLE